MRSNFSQFITSRYHALKIVTGLLSHLSLINHVGSPIKYALILQIILYPCYNRLINYEMKVFDTRNLKGKDILFDWIAIKKIFHRTWCVLLPLLHELLLIDGPKFTKCI